MVEEFTPNEYIAGCAQYSLKLVCTDPQDKLDHSTGENGNCTTSITEFGASEEGGGSYENNLIYNGTSLTTYAAIRNCLAKLNENTQYSTVTWSTLHNNNKDHYHHKGWMKFTKITGEAANHS